MGRAARIAGALLILAAGAVFATLAIRDRVALHDAPRFADVTASAPFSGYRGMTYGAAWGDFDGDGWPDLYVTNHLNGAKLYRNLGDRRFADVTDEWFSPADTGGDKHGAAWADFDNDGRLDLAQLTGAERGVGQERKRLFRNLGTRFEDIAQLADISNPLSRTRMPLWVDIDRDGRLDLVQGAEARPDGAHLPFIFMQREGKFHTGARLAAFASQSAPFCVLTQLSASPASDLLCRVAGKGVTAQIFSNVQLPLRELDLLPVTAFEDVAAGDFDNDGLVDVYLARKNPAPAVSFGRPSPNDLMVDTWIDSRDSGKVIGFNFRTTGRQDWRVVPIHPSDAINPERVFIGKESRHPPGLEFSLSADADSGAAPAPSGAGLYIGLRNGTEWQVRLAAADGGRDGRPQYQRVAIRISSTAPITDLEGAGYKAAPEEAPGRLFMNRRGKLVEEAEKRGLNSTSLAAVNAVAGDFNNDMHLDLFIVASGDIGKQENVLLLNRGDGRFVSLAGAGGTAGDTAGVGDSVTTVDFDRDGFLDLLVTTGGSMGRSMGMPSDAGGYRLYRNLGNDNRWLEIDLEGTRSNRDGIGARVELTAGGITQVRIQDGGVHHRAQNHARLHFGLAKHAQADRITVRWPSGTVQELKDVKANQVLRIKEP
jgi:hypothetical protein